MINRALYDAWKIKPPCEIEEGKCHGECPYYSECYFDYDDVDEWPDEWPDNYEDEPQI